jgi:hypothetical protein
MTTCVVMVTVSERLDALNNFLRTMAEHEPGRAIFIHMQGEDRLSEVVIPKGVEDAGMIWSSERMGCHAARVVALRALAGDVFDTYVNVDDDVELIKQTNWQPAIDKARKPGVGFVLTNWVRHPNLLPAAIERMEDKFYKQIMVYQGGGMAYDDEVADLMRALDPVPARYDDIWPLTAYLAGYRSFRYQGSLAVHRIMTKGGMNTYMRAEPRPLLCWEWVDYKPLLGAPVGSDYSIPMDKDLRPAARVTHERNRIDRGWPLPGPRGSQTAKDLLAMEAL